MLAVEAVEIESILTKRVHDELYFQLSHPVLLFS